MFLRRPKKREEKVEEDKKVVGRMRGLGWRVRRVAVRCVLHFDTSYFDAHPFLVLNIAILLLWKRFACHNCSCALVFRSRFERVCVRHFAPN
jgi:hypothetical protein